MALNIITAKFCSGAMQTWASDAWQYDYGQVLQFDGLDLPEAYQVHFSNEPMTGETITQIGNADGVSVPDQFFQNGDPIYAWVYLHEGEDDGETVYMVTIPVHKRPQPSEEVPTPVEQSAIDQAIAALNIAVEKAEDAIEHYPQIIDGTWHVWDVIAEAYVDTGVEAQGDPGTPGAPGTPGDDGFSPTVTVTEITGGHRVVITDASGEHTFDVMDGEGGSAITVDSAMSSTSENPVQNKVINAALGDLMEDLNELRDGKADIIISSAEGAVASFSDGAEYDAVSLIAHFEPYQEGTGDPSPDNVRPIHGWTGLDINQAGENLAISNVIYCGKLRFDNSGVMKASVYSTWCMPIPKGMIACHKITVASGRIQSLGTSDEIPQIDTPFWGVDGARGSSTSFSNYNTRIVNNTAGHKYLVILGSNAEGTEWETSVKSNELMISMDVVEPYVDPVDGKTTPISWQTEAGEVFGGYVDVTRGKVVATWYGFVLDGVNNYLNSSPNSDENVAWAYDYMGENGLSKVPRSSFSVLNPDGYISLNSLVKVDKFTLVSSTPTSTGIGSTNKGSAYLRLYVTKTELSDVSSATAIRNSLREWLQSNPIQIVYKLSSPIEYDITPTAITLLKGYNNVWNSAGGNNEVEYRADTKLYIDGKQLDIRNTIAPIEDGDTASQAYAVGRYFYRNGEFCKAKAAIASGAAFTLNTNYEVTTVANELYTALH